MEDHKSAPKNCKHILMILIPFWGNQINSNKQNNLDTFIHLQTSERKKADVQSILPRQPVVPPEKVFEVCLYGPNTFSGGVWM